VEHSAKNQKSAKKQICGFFHFPEKSQKIPKTGYFFKFFWKIKKSANLLFCGFLVFSGLFHVEQFFRIPESRL